MGEVCRSARLWGLGRETVRKLVKDDPGVIKNQNGKEESAHGLQHSRIRGAAHSHAPAQRRLTAAARHCHQLRFVILERILEDFREPRLTLGNPPRVVLTHGLFVVAEKVCHIRDGPPRWSKIRANVCRNL
jgi:hypothetical protein